MIFNLNLISKRKKRFTLTLFLCVAILFITSKDMHTNDEQVGQKAPLFSLKDLQGNSYSLRELIGKKVVHLTFLATWCEPCERDYQKLNDDYVWFESKGYILLGIGVPTRQNQKKLKEFAIKQSLRFPILFDSSGEVVKLYNASLPQNIIIDKKGVVVYQWDFLPSNHKKMIEALLSDEQ